MNTRDTIKSWKWRIVRAGHSQMSFAVLINVSVPALSGYINGNITPSIERFELIEGKLRELELELELELEER